MTQAMRHAAQSLPLTQSLAAFVELTKPRLTAMAALSAVAGYVLAFESGGANSWTAFCVFVGAFLVGGAANALNQYIERDFDSIMPRTRHRPIPSGRIAPRDALVFGAVTASIGLDFLLFTTTLMSAALAAVVLGIYLAIYTPMKQRSPWNTVVGAFPGAGPILLGWAAAAQPMNAVVVAVFAVMLLWQLPHFFAICWLYGDDYRAANYVMWPLKDPEGHRTGRQILGLCAMLLPISLLPLVAVGAPPLLLISGTLLGACYMGLSVEMARSPSRNAAFKSFLASVTYLPLLLTLYWFALN